MKISNTKENEVLNNFCILYSAHLASLTSLMAVGFGTVVSV